jgi:HD-GYP domain-containing protein (c-di-GMP phosphodiesterase class II)/sensor domain CHASE-containing protein
MTQFIKDKVLRLPPSLVAAITMIGFSLIFFGISARLMLSQAETLEKASVIREIDRAREFLDLDLQRMLTLISKYAASDETYSFLKTNDSAYITNNYAAEMFINSQIDLVTILKLDGTLLMAQVYDSNRGTFIPLPNGLSSYFSPDTPLLALRKPGDQISGIVALAEGPLKIAARTITNNHNEGPISGIVIFGRFLNRKDIGEWAALSHLSLDARLYTDPALPSDYQTAKIRLAALPEQPLTAIIGGDRIAAYGLLPDLSGRPGLILRVDLARDLVNQVETQLWLLGLSLAGVALVAGGLVAFLLNRLASSQRATEKLAGRLTIINELTHTLSGSPGMEELANQLLMMLREITGCYTVNLFSVKAGELKLLAGAGGYAAGQLPLSFRLPPPDGIVAIVAQTGKHLRVPDVTQSPYFRLGEGLPNTRSELALPVRLNKSVGSPQAQNNAKVTAVLDLQAEQVDAFDEVDLETLQMLADQLALALDNARLYEETHHRASEVEKLLDISEKRLQQVESLRTVDMAITSSLDLPVILQILLEQVVTQLKVDAASVLLYRPELQSLEYAAKRGFSTDVFENARLRLGEGYAGQAALEQRVVQVTDLRWQNDAAACSPLLDQEGFVTYLAMPLLVKGQVKGVLEIFQREIFQPAPDWLNFLESLSHWAAIAIENATLMEGLEKANSELIAAYDATIEGWALALEMRDHETEGHSRRVTELTVTLGRAFGVGAEELVHLRRGAFLHDIGKMAIPDGILLKPGPLSVEEWQVMQLHPWHSFQMLSSIPFLRSALDIPYCHHECWDGSGYPRGLHEEQIPLAARIFSVVEVWDAVTHSRPYSPIWTKAQAVDHLRLGIGKQFDPEVVQSFLELVEKGIIT